MKIINTKPIEIIADGEKILLSIGLTRYTDNSLAVIAVMADDETDFWCDLSINTDHTLYDYQFVLNHNVDKEVMKPLLDFLVDADAYPVVANYGFVTNQPVYKIKEKFIPLIPEMSF